MKTFHLAIIAVAPLLCFMWAVQNTIHASQADDIYHLVPVEQDKKPSLNFTANGQVETVEISDNGLYVTAGTEAGDRNGSVYYFDRNGTLLWNHAVDRQILDIAVSSDGMYIAAAGSQFYHYGTYGPAGLNNGEVYYFDSKGDLLWKYNGTGSVAVTSIAVSSDGSYVAVGSDKAILYFDRQGDLLWSHPVTRSNDHFVAISPEGSYVATKDDAVVEFLDNHGNLLWNYTAGHGTTENTSAGSPYLTMSPDGRYVITSDYSEGILVFDDTGKLILGKSTGEHFFYESMSYDGSTIAASAQQWGQSDPGATYLYDKNGTLLWSYPGEVMAEVSGNGQYVLGGIGHYGGPTLFFFDRKGDLLWNSNADDVKTLATSHDGTLSVAGTGFGNIGGSVLFYNQENNGSSTVLQSNITHLFTQSPDTPLKQFKSGIAAGDVKCNVGLQLILKTEDGTPACVGPDTAQKLMEKGWAEKGHIGISTFEHPPVGIYNLTSSTKPIILGMPFYIKAVVTNYQTEPITYYNGCLSPLSVSFDNIKTITDDVHCHAISRYTLGPNQSVPVQSDKIETVYNETGPNATTYAQIKFSYEIDGKQASMFTSTQIPIQAANKLADLANDTGTVTFGNQTYYFETPNYTNDAYFHPVQISFHDVTFTLFPSGFRGGLPIPCNLQGTYQYYWTDAKFADNTHELLHIQVSSPPCANNPVPSMFSTHTNPQAGLTFYITCC
ncbi:MAG: WD40 repeat domain-containing protein, partial [Nitrosotalea sp.]